MAVARVVLFRVIGIIPCRRWSVLAALAAVSLLTGCENRDAANDEQAAPQASADPARERQERDEAQRLALARRGQGCRGRVLRDLDLREAVADKQVIPHFRTSDGPSEVRQYHADGRYEIMMSYGATMAGRYWVDGDRLCHGLPRAGPGERAIDHCVRLVRTAGGETMEEHLAGTNPERFQLRCMPIELEDLEPPPPPPPLTPKRAVPSNSPLSWITSDDYPSRARADKVEGRVGFLLTIDTGGRVAACEVTKPSGASALDEATCRLITSRARFEPVTNGMGVKTRGTYVGVVVWTIPD